LLQFSADVTPVKHSAICSLDCSCSSDCASSLDDELSLFANAGPSPETEIVPYTNADAMKIANMPVLLFFVMLLIVIRIHSSN
jgi:hypothetical protein